MAGEGSSAFEVEEGEKLIVLSVRKDESVSSATESQYWEYLVRNCIWESLEEFDRLIVRIDRLILEHSLPVLMNLPFPVVATYIVEALDIVN